jgi:hypothetical protein
VGTRAAQFPVLQCGPLERSTTAIQDAQQQKTYTRKLQWGNSLSELIQDIQLQANILEPEALISTPEAFLNMEGKQTVTAAVVYRYGMTPDHGAKPGLMPGDRRDLAEKIAEFIAPTLIFTETPKKVPYVSAKINNPLFTKKAFVERRQLITQAVGDVLTLEIWHQPDGMANILVRTICDELGLVPSDADAATPTWVTKELTVTIRKHSLGALGELLQIGNTKGRRRERLHAAIAQRIRDVEEQLAMVPSMGAHAAFIELADALGFKGVTDPKYALRLGFASRGRVTQFITPPGDERTDPLSCPKHTSGIALDQQRSNHPRGNRLWRPISICYQDSRTAYRAHQGRLPKHQNAMPERRQSGFCAWTV